MNEFVASIGPVLSVLAFVSIVGGAAGYFKASRGESIIKYQAIELGLRAEKITNLEKDIVTKDAAIKTSEATCASKDETIAELKRNNSYLQKLGQGSPQLKKLTIAIENQTKLVTEYMKRESGKK